MVMAVHVRAATMGHCSTLLKGLDDDVEGNGQS